MILARNSYPIYEILGALCTLNPTLDSQIKLTRTLGLAPYRMNGGWNGNVEGIARLLLIEIVGPPNLLSFVSGGMEPVV